MKIKTLFLFFSLFLLTGCTNKLIPAKTEHVYKEESSKDTTQMSVNEVEQELKDMDDLNFDQEIDNIGKELK